MIWFQVEPVRGFVRFTLSRPANDKHKHPEWTLTVKVHFQHVWLTREWRIYFLVLIWDTHRLTEHLSQCKQDGLIWLIHKLVTCYFEFIGSKNQLHNLFVNQATLVVCVAWPFYCCMHFYSISVNNIYLITYSRFPQRTKLKSKSLAKLNSFEKSF